METLSQPSERQDVTSCVVLLSGGQDSTTCLFWAVHQFDRVHAISFDYGQMHAKELEFAQANAKRAGATWELINVRGTLAGSSLLGDGDHNDSHSLSDALPASFVPGRNLLFLTIAAGRAVVEGCQDIVTGVCQTDYSGYPDCRRETMDSLEQTLALGIGLDVTIHTPLMDLSKAETWKLAADLGVVSIIRDHTLTDYNGNLTKNEWGYGALDNPASVLRAKGYDEAVEMGWL